MKTKTVSKPTSAKSLKQMMAKPIGGNVETPKPASADIGKAQGAAESKGKAEQAKAPKGKTLYYFSMTPSGRMLRAYFIAMIQLQTGGALKVGAVFKLWPSCNIRGHLDTRKIERKDAGYALTVAGYNYFMDPLQAADKDLLAKFAAAIKSGTRPDIFKHQMLPLSK